MRTVAAILKHKGYQVTTIEPTAVMDHDVLVGLISIGDVVKARIMEKESEADSLKAYVGGTG